MTTHNDDSPWPKHIGNPRVSINDLDTPGPTTGGETARTYPVDFGSLRGMYDPNTPAPATPVEGDCMHLGGCTDPECFNCSVTPLQPATPGATVTKREEWVVQFAFAQRPDEWEDWLANRECQTEKAARILLEQCDQEYQDVGVLNRAVHRVTTISETVCE